MNLWFVSMECAGIAEAGGVKNVTFSLCKEFSKLGHNVTLFIPVFKCNTWDLLTDIVPLNLEKTVSLCNKKETVKYTTALCNSGNFKVVLINHHSFSEKEAVYTYTENEEKLNPEHKKGQGHKDLLFKDILFQKSVCEYLSLINETDKKQIPHIIHCQDASTAVLPAFVKECPVESTPACVVTIHNAGPYYHHEFKNMEEAVWYTELHEELLQRAKNGERVEPFLIAAESGAELSTVSEVYAEELIDPANCEVTDGLSVIFKEKNIKIKGITNGFDFERYDPENTLISKLPYSFSPETGNLQGKIDCRKYFIKEIARKSDYSAEGIKKIGTLECSENGTEEVFVSYHGRVTTQKGISVLNASIPLVLEKNPDTRFIIAGQGDPVLEKEIVELTDKYSGKILFINGYNQSVVRLVTAISDFIVLPSFFEPCGLEDFIAQAYGTLPVAHKTGGLNKIEEGKTGFLYTTNDGSALAEKLYQVICIKKDDDIKIKQMIVEAAKSVHTKYYWENVVKNEYLKYFEEILKK